MAEDNSNSPPKRRHLLGLRGFLAIQSFLWTFLQTFVPVAVKDSANTSGRPYEQILRQSLSVLFWNDSLIYSSFIFLSARTLCIPYLESPGKTTAASAIFRRGLRLWFPTAVSLAIVKILSSTIGTTHIDEYKRETGNVSIEVPYEIPNALAYFNSVFNLFWTHNNNPFNQAGNTAFPSQTLWIINVIYAQSSTVYLTMLITPYTRDAWRVKAYISFILSAWWVQSWAWYTISGLLLTDAVMNMQYVERAKRGIKIWRSIRCPVWIASLVLMAAGLVMQYLWTDWRPRYGNKELLAHASLYHPDAPNTALNPKDPQARDDSYLIIVGFHLLLEYSTLLQTIFQNPFFVYLGRRSFSKLHLLHTHPVSQLLTPYSPNHPGIFLIQSIIIYTAGIKLHLHLSTHQEISLEASRSICLTVCVAAVVLGAEVFYRLVDRPSKLLARVLFDWIRR